MPFLRVENAQLSHGGRPLFGNVSFTVDKADRWGLVGNNGSGKTSLVRALMGELGLDRGDIILGNTVLGYAAQHFPPGEDRKTCHEFLVDQIPAHMRDTLFWKADMALDEIGLDEALWHEPAAHLSGGWQRLLLLAGAALVKEPDVLILDEPTNHLDLGRIFWLEEWLDKIKTPYILISHDRELLDRLTDKTLFLRPDRMHAYNAPFSRAREQLLLEDLAAARQKRQEDAEIKRLERSAKRLKEWSTKRGVSTVLAKRAKAVESRVGKIRAERTETHVEQGRDITLHHEEIAAHNAIVINKVSIASPDGTVLFTIDRMVIKKGDRIALLGENGAGKSVFLGMLIRQFERMQGGSVPEEGIYFNPQLRLGYLDQHLNLLPPGATAFSWISGQFKLNRTDTTRELIMAGFPVAEQNKAIETLSGGDRARLALLSLKLEKPNLFILDEPTNHLDIQGREALEDELDDGAHTCLIVSHDRRLVRGAATRFFEIANGRLREVDSVDPFFNRMKGAGREGSAPHDRTTAKPDKKRKVTPR